MRRQAIPLGPAYAWQDAAGKWWFSPYRFMAPGDAVKVERFFADGEIVLYRDFGAGGEFIRGAEQV